MIDNKIYSFWQKNSLQHIKPRRGGEYPEGWNVPDFFKNLYTKQEYGDVIEIGCGYGRLCTGFSPDKYLGLDFSISALDRASALFPHYKFKLLKNEEKYPISKTKLVYTVLLHQTDEDIEDMIKSLANTSDRVIIGEILGRDWRREGNPPVFNRELEEYVDMMAKYNKELKVSYRKPYAAYNTWRKKDTNMSILVFE